MIRLIQRRLIIPRGDTGRFSLPKLITNNTGDAAIFSILDPKTHKKVFEKRAEVSDNSILIEFNHGDTVNLPVGKYVWDIKFYCDPVFVNEKIVDGQEIDSYYAAFTLPVCEIRQTGDNLLMADDTPNSKLTPESINYLTEAIANVNNTRNQTAQYASNANNSAQNSAAEAASAAASADAAAASAELAQSSADKITGLVIQSTTLPSNSQATTNYDAENGILTIGIPHGNGIASTVFNNNYTLTITLDDGTTFTTPSLRGQQGEQGLPFFFETTYPNIDDMYANMYIDNIPEGRYVIIQSNVENVNNGKVYQRHGDTYDFIVDLSGNRGPRGIGIISIEKTGTSGLTDTYTITYSDDSTSTFTVNNGATGATGAIPQFSIGSVTEGIIADASISGTASNPVLNLVLPQATVPSEISSFTNDVGYLTDFDLAKGEPYGVASLDSSGKVPSNQLPSYVDDVLEFPSLSDFPETGETGKIYVALDTNLSYRWGGSSYVMIASSLALGETSETAYRGDRGKIAYDHAQAKGNAYASGLYKITTNNEGHVTNATAVTKADINALDVPGDLIAIQDAQPTAEENEIWITETPPAGIQVPTYEEFQTALDTKAPVIYYTVLGNSYTDTISIEDAAVDMPFKSIIIPIKYSAESINSRYTITGVDSINLNLTEMPSDRSAAPRTEQYTVNFANTEAGTVYGGYYDIISGELTVTHEMLDLGSIVYNQFAIDGTNKHGYYSQALYDKKKYVPGGDEIDETFDTERYPNVSENEVKTGNRLRCIAGGANYYIYIYDDDYATSTTAEFKEGISGTKFVYELQTPVKYQLTSQEIRTLGARNYLYTDTYTPLASVTYPIDTKSYIDWKITDLTDEIPNVPVQDVQVNGTSVLNSGVANVPIASSSNCGVVKTNGTYGTSMRDAPYNDTIMIVPSRDSAIKSSNNSYNPITPTYQHLSTFYGLAKAAGDTTQSQSNNAVGAYTDEAKAAIQHMLGIDDLIGTVESNYTASKAYAIGDIFVMDGTLYRATAAMAIGDTITPDTNCEAVDAASGFAAKKDTVLETTLSLGRRQGTTIGANSVTLGKGNIASEKYSLAANQATIALGLASFASGSQTHATGTSAHAEGRYTVASGAASHAEGYSNRTSIKLTGNENTTTYTFNSGLTTDNVGDYLNNNSGIAAKIISVDELNNTVTTDITFGSALSNSTIYLFAANARGVGSHIEGHDCRALNTAAHAEGYKTIASGIVSHSENAITIASGAYAHAENNMTVASGMASHSEGCITLANGCNMHASGQANVAAIIYEEWVASTSYNENDIVSYNGTGYICTNTNSDAEWTSANWRMLPSNTNIAFVVGNGTADNARSNAYALTWTGDGRYAGDIYVGCNNDSTGGTKLAKITDLPEYATDLETQAIINEWEVVV